MGAAETLLEEGKPRPKSNREGTGGGENARGPRRSSLPHGPWSLDFDQTSLAGLLECETASRERTVRSRTAERSQKHRLAEDRGIVLSGVNIARLFSLTAATYLILCISNQVDRGVPRLAPANSVKQFGNIEVQVELNETSPAEIGRGMNG